jgi:hypothetical protein
MKTINNFISNYKTASGVSAFMWLFTFAGPALTEASTVLVYTSVVLSGLSIYALAFIGYTAVLGALNPEPEVLEVPEVLESVEKPKRKQTQPKQTKAKNNGN